jgi:succinate-semialdehyde dehydrogenase/glutarate-semialdehyde dehydrogenase
MPEDHDFSYLSQEISEGKDIWSGYSFAKRAEILKETATNLLDNKNQLAEIATLEMGKVKREGVAEIEKCAFALNYFARNAKDFLKPEYIETEYSTSKIIFQPLGTILAIMPWNFPFWQVFRAVAPIMMAGNTMVLKHASNVRKCAAMIEDILRDSGVPKGGFINVFVSGKEVLPLINLPDISAVTLTGSTDVGKIVAEQAGRAMKKCVLELGGSDPYIILKDADISLAAEACCKSRLINAGQSCISAKRFIVASEIYDDFTEIFKQKMERAIFGDPLNSKTDIGPLASKEFRDELHNQVNESVLAGAKLITGGYIPENKGAFYPPTILADVRPGMRAFDEELFGPVAAIIKAGNESDAISLANNSLFGLGAAIFSKDISHAEDLAERLYTGCVFINDFVKSDPRLPFGGVKESGYGRELGSYGIKEFVNVKTICTA